MKILYVEHAAYYPEENKKYLALSRLDNLDISVIKPSNWCDEARKEIVIDNLIDGYSEIKKEVFLPGRRHRSFFKPGIANTIKELQPDLIHLFGEANTFFALQIALLRNKYMKSTRLLFDNFENIYYKRPPYKFGWIYNRIEKYVFTSATAATFRYKESRDFLRKRGFTKKLFYLPWCTDEELFRPVDSTHIKNIHNLDGFTFGYFGRLESSKGIVSLLEAFQAMDDDSKLLIVGKGSLENQLREMIKAKLLENKVSLTGYIPQSDLPAYYSAIDCLVIPSQTTATWKEQFGRVIIEAMSCETPVIGSDSGAIPDVIGNAGLIFREDSVSDLKTTLETIKMDHELYSRLKKNGRQRVLEHYSLPAFSTRCLSIYNEIMSEDAHSN